MAEPFRILLVEDNLADADLVREALEEAAMPFRMDTLPDGIDALLYLRKEAPYTGAAKPDLVLLDLNMPRMGGFEVLAQMKADPQLRRIPVLILSSSTASADVLRGYDLHANSYIAKPADVSEFFASIRRLHRFWLSTALLPERAQFPDGSA
jgi:CheY-like chemotaxis protein